MERVSFSQLKLSVIRFNVPLTLSRWENVGGLEKGTGNLLKYDHPATNAREFFRVVVP